jgi:hypothetical protein
MDTTGLSKAQTPPPPPPIAPPPVAPAPATPAHLAGGGDVASRVALELIATLANLRRIETCVRGQLRIAERLIPASADAPFLERWGHTQDDITRERQLRQSQLQAIEREIARILVHIRQVNEDFGGWCDREPKLFNFYALGVR